MPATTGAVRGPISPFLTHHFRRFNAAAPTGVPLWGYFSQISDSTTSYGSYSGAVLNETITREKLGIDTPRHIIESDASIVAPLLFALTLGQ